MNTDFKPGDIVRIKPEWLDSYDEIKFRYVILEQTGTNRYLIQILNCKLPLAPTEVVSGDMIQHADL